jgi:hypothetical protein
VKVIHGSVPNHRTVAAYKRRGCELSASLSGQFTPWKSYLNKKSGRLQNQS